MVVNIEPIVGFSVGITFYFDRQAAILEIGIIRFIFDWQAQDLE